MENKNLQEQLNNFNKILEETNSSDDISFKKILFKSGLVVMLLLGIFSLSYSSINSVDTTPDVFASLDEEQAAGVFPTDEEINDIITADIEADLLLDDSFDADLDNDFLEAMESDLDLSMEEGDNSDFEALFAEMESSQTEVLEEDPALDAKQLDPDFMHAASEEAANTESLAVDNSQTIHGDTGPSLYIYLALLPLLLIAYRKLNII